MVAKTYTVGIDLGTSNSALAFAGTAGGGIEFLEIEQIESPGQIARHATLPSALYIPHEGEVQPNEVHLPWEEAVNQSAICGTWARLRGMQVPDRYIASAKSWLGYGNINPREKILPWKSDIPFGKHSPVEVSKRLLEHLRFAFEHNRALHDEAVSLSECHTVVTVPASFDEIARNLTYEAARDAGLNQVTLLEEPLAAFYAWIAQSKDQWRDAVEPGDLILVCDIGGGTTDFSLVAISEENGQLKLERISVGEHLLLGGDNMDLALAYHLKSQIELQGAQLDHWQFLGLVNSARHAKEILLSNADVDAVPVSIAGRGSSLFAQTISTTLQREAVSSLLLQGYFPLTNVDQLPVKKGAVGIREFGLAYETEAAVTKHLAKFLKRSRQNIESNDSLKKLVSARLNEDTDFLAPTAVLFNGGVFKAKVLRERIIDVLGYWNQNQPPKELAGSNFDLAVAYGAAYYGKMKASGEGIRIRSGTAKSYYIGLETPMPAVPGFEPPVKGLCLVPQGTEEGSEIFLEDEQFGLVVGEPVEFRFFSSDVRAGDAVGTYVNDAEHNLEESARLSVTLPADEVEVEIGEVVPVKLDAVVTEVGTLQLFMKHVSSNKKWNLEFDVRSDGHRY